MCRLVWPTQQAWQPGQEILYTTLLLSSSFTFSFKDQRKVFCFCKVATGCVGAFEHFNSLMKLSVGKLQYCIIKLTFASESQNFGYFLEEYLQMKVKGWLNLDCHHILLNLVLPIDIFYSFSIPGTLYQEILECTYSNTLFSVSYIF